MEEYDFLKQCLAERRGLTQPLTAPAVSGSTLSGAQVVSSKVELPEWVSTTPKEPPNAEYYYFLGMSSNDTKYPGDQPIEDFTRRAHRRQAATSPRFEGSSTVTTAILLGGHSATVSDSWKLFSWSKTARHPDRSGILKSL